VTDPLIAELALRETEASLARAKAIRRALVVPLRLAALVDAIGTAAVLVVGRFHLLPVLGPAYVVALAASWMWYRRYAKAHGVHLPTRPWVLIIGGLVVVAASLSRAGAVFDLPWLSDFGPGLANALAVAVAAMWLRSAKLGITAAGMAAACVAVSMVAAGDAAVSLQSAAFAILLVFASTGIPQVDPIGSRKEGR
jgi:hypothetical protein